MSTDPLDHLSWCPACHGDRWEPGDDDLCDRHDAQGETMTDADPATERDFDAAAVAGTPVTVVGTRPPWQVHDSPPPTHGTPAAEPADGPGWDQEVLADLARCLRTVGYTPQGPDAGRVGAIVDLLATAAVAWERRADDAEADLQAARAELAEALNDVDDRDVQISTLRDDLNHQTGAAFDNQAEADRLRAELAQVTADRDRYVDTEATDEH
jgi:hypothetical protein